MTEPVAAIVVAAGSGRRLGGSTAGGTTVKALRTLAGVPLVTRSVAAMAAGGVERVVVVINPDYADDFRAALAGTPVPVTMVPGGAERQDSVRNGLAALGAGGGVVLVHDAARPLVPADVTRRVIRAVQEGAPAVIPVVAVTDSIRRIDGAGSVVVDREPLRAVQTPQGFDLATLRAAHAAARGSYTDDAAVCEAHGAVVTLVEGSARSMKITHPTDFAAAAALLEES